MIKFEFLVASESIIKDTEKNTFSAINILEDYAVESIPAFIGKLSLLLITTREVGDPETIDVILEVKNNSHVIFSPPPLNINFQGKTRANTGINIGSLPISEIGTLKFIFNYIDVANIEYGLKISMRPPSNPPIS